MDKERNESLKRRASGRWDPDYLRNAEEGWTVKNVPSWDHRGRCVCFLGVYLQWKFQYQHRYGTKCTVDSMVSHDGFQIWTQDMLVLFTYIDAWYIIPCQKIALKCLLETAIVVARVKSLYRTHVPYRINKLTMKKQKINKNIKYTKCNRINIICLCMKGLKIIVGYAS